MPDLDTFTVPGKLRDRKGKVVDTMRAVALLCDAMGIGPWSQICKDVTPLIDAQMPVSAVETLTLSSLGYRP